MKANTLRLFLSLDDKNGRTKARTCNQKGLRLLGRGPWQSWDSAYSSPR